MRPKQYSHHVTSNKKSAGRVVPQMYDVNLEYKDYVLSSRDTTRLVFALRQFQYIEVKDIKKSDITEEEKRERIAYISEWINELIERLLQ